MKTGTLQIAPYFKLISPKIWRYPINVPKLIDQPLMIGSKKDNLHDQRFLKDKDNTKYNHE